MARPEKEAAVTEIAGKLAGAEAALLTEYRGLTVGQMAEVRSALLEIDADYKVYKNTLARIAVRQVGLEELIERLEGPTAIAFCNGDAVAAAKAIDDAIRKYPVLVLKGGVLSGRVLGPEEARDLATIEPREVQLATIARMVNAPVQQTANLLAALLRDLGSMLVKVMGNKEVANGGGSQEEEQ